MNATARANPRFASIPTALALALAVLSTAGCGGGAQVEVIDLNRVLDVLQKLLDEGSKEGAGGTDVAKAEGAGEGQADKQATTEVASKTALDDPAKLNDFLQTFADRLNAARLVSYPIGVRMNPTGAIEGFQDPNKNLRKEGAETRIFTIEIDTERNRLIASDTHGYRRDHQYRPRFGGGFFSGYMFGAMMNRQNSYYTGGRQKPAFGAMSMSSPNYHSGAVSSVRAKTGTGVRSRSGTGGFFGSGK